MKVYSINYDLKIPGRDYSQLHEAIKRSGKWWHFLGSTWLVQTTESAEQIWNRLAPHIDTNDFMLIIEVRQDASGWLPKEAWDWISSNIPLP